MDMWASEDGVSWRLLSATPWNASSPEEVKYDFDSLVLPEGFNGTPAVYTFGGDRETFNPFDPTNYLNVDNDVWRFDAVPEPGAFALSILGFFGLLSLRMREVTVHGLARRESQANGRRAEEETRELTIGE